ncbi:hypothetical protein GCM10008994_20590 [Halorubrum ejinorense]|uniref:Uncharacterized protein n=1 Tax=Halorubrum ejinorense TaxID=425309 RepID=A0AAV3ST36_9EURY
MYSELTPDSITLIFRALNVILLNELSVGKVDEISIRHRATRSKTYWEAASRGGVIALESRMEFVAVERI